MASNIGLWGRLFVLLAISFFLVACDGDDGAVGPQGPQGDQGDQGDPGPVPDDIAAAIASANVEACATCHGGIGVGEHQSVYDKYVNDSILDLNFSSVASVDAGDGTFTVTLEFEILKNGLLHNDPQCLGPFPVQCNLPSFDQKSFYSVQYDSVAGQYLNSQSMFSTRTGREIGDLQSNGDGTYTLTVTGEFSYAPETPVAPFDGAQVYGYIAQGALLHHEGATSELPEGTHVHLYDDVSNTAMSFGTADDTDPNAYESLANVSGCVNCHGAPYMKHGYRDPIVAGLPDFASCKSCHYDDRNGGHEDWQYMVDDPANWAIAGLLETDVEAKYAYKAKLMNDVHMAHAMEFPYPRSMANCATCHNGLTEGGLSKLDLVLDNSNFTPETCKSCHPVEGLNAWPEDAGTVLQGDYAQAERAPPLMYLWTKHGVEGVHDINGPCTVCHGVLPNAPLFNELHTGYDVRIADDTGQKYRDLYTASIDNVSVDLLTNVMTIDFRAEESAIVNAIPGTLDVHVYVSFYGWDSKHFIVPSHTRDGSGACQRWSRDVPPVSSTRDCRYEVNTLAYTDDPANADPSKAYNPLFPSLTEVAAGSWQLTVDMAAWVGGQPGLIPDLIADGTIKMTEVTLASRLDVTGHDNEDIAANLNAVTQSFDLGAGALVDNYFKLENAIVDVAKCEKCHDQLAVTWHSGRGRGGDIVACRNCHNPTYPGSHVEMASRSVENYVHAIHTFQDFDVDDTFHDDAPPDDPAHGEDFDPVFAKRYDQHIQHVFPNFTIRNCEACHVTADAATGIPGVNYPVTYNVPDQTKSMPGALSRAQTVDNWYEMVSSGGNIPSTIAVLKDERNIGSVPETVTGPASRACGGCHRARLINRDLAGDLASFNAHTEVGGTYVENLDTSNDTVLFGIIEKIMKMFE